jgi:hypothetical protein
MTATGRLRKFPNLLLEERSLRLQDQQRTLPPRNRRGSIAAVRRGWAGRPDHARADKYAPMHSAAPTTYSSQVPDMAYG